MSGAHSILPPSSSARRIQCSASTLAEQQYPQGEDSPEAAEGTAAHWGLAEMLHGRLIDVGLIAPNGVYLTDEMVQAVDVAHADIVRELAVVPGMHTADGYIERPVDIRPVHDQSWGTPDYAAWLPGPHLMAWDFKYGHRHVEAFENAQMVEYVAGLLAEEPWRNVSDQTIRVTVKIVQPRSFHRDGPVRSWSFMASDIRAHVNIASNAAHEALGPNPRFRVGPGCRDCSARHACAALQSASLTACDVAGSAQPFDLPPRAMALEYLMLKRYEGLLSARITGLEEQALALVKRGQSLPGLRVEHGAGRERWTVTDAQVIQIGQALGVNIAKPAQAMTPKQAVSAGLPEAVLPGLVNTPRGEARLVQDDGATARRVFA